MTAVTVDEAGERFSRWLERQVVEGARGDHLHAMPVDPSGKFWLGRLAPEATVVASGLGDRGERLDPCAIAIRIQLSSSPPWSLNAECRFAVWRKIADGSWEKGGPISVCLSVPMEENGIEQVIGASKLGEALESLSGTQGLGAELRASVERRPGGTFEVTVSLVNTSPQQLQGLHDTNLYECELRLSDLPTTPFLLEALPDSFRYDRRIPAYGLNCGVIEELDGTLKTVDVIDADQPRRQYWGSEDIEPDLSFDTLSTDPVSSLRQLVNSLRTWGDSAWGEETLDARRSTEGWNESMADEAVRASGEFQVELGRVADGLAELEADSGLLRCFKWMNEAMRHSANGKYPGWRPFQIGFLLATLRVVKQRASDTAEIVWFPTGGGKTETYLGLLVLAALYGRLTGTNHGIVAWSRFPLRMLSLQQTQRFADAMAGAELVREREGLPGDEFSVGFLVGQGATPNSIKVEAKEWEPDPDDPLMPGRFQVLLRCPFCHDNKLSMVFDRQLWRLEHRCTNEACSKRDKGLPFFVVDDEIFRFLPTVVIGTLDKAALIGFQSGMRAMVGPPLGLCSKSGHGYTYAPRSTRPSGCLVPGCRNPATPVTNPQAFGGPSFRLQDELHLLRDSLGAVDAHYEALYDDLQLEITGRRATILASSATLVGYAKQVDVLYQRAATVFPVLGPSGDSGFWTKASSSTARRYVGLAPRGVTSDYAVDQALTQLQAAVRYAHTNPGEVAAAVGVSVELIPTLVSLYGTNVVYGNTLRDLEASLRSVETQIAVQGALNTATLTGRTEFDQVRQTLDRLELPESEFLDRIHIVAASSMMSHGVDIDRLNVMVMLGLPLANAEFIQATSRVGRRWPGLVFVIHKIARERDASVFRSFVPFVLQGDRFVEPVPVTKKSRRVLQNTVSGMTLARILMLYEPQSGIALTTVGRLRQFCREAGISHATEVAALGRALGLGGDQDAPMMSDLDDWLRRFFANLEDPAGTFQFPADLSPTGKPMISLRDVEEQAPITGVLEQ